jgi:hypothetical protein
MALSLGTLLMFNLLVVQLMAAMAIIQTVCFNIISFK